MFLLLFFLFLKEIEMSERQLKVYVTEKNVFPPKQQLVIILAQLQGMFDLIWNNAEKMTKRSYIKAISDMKSYID